MSNVKKSKKNNSSKKQSSSNPISTTWLKYIIPAILVIGAICIAISINGKAEITQPNMEINFEDEVFSIAEDLASSPDYVPDDAFSLNGIKLDTTTYAADTYIVKINNCYYEAGYPTASSDFFGTTNAYDGVYETTEFTEFNKHQEKLIESAKQYVIKYINDSDILQDKEYLVEEIQNTPFYLYTDTTHEELYSCITAPGVHIGSAIFLNKEYEDFFSEYMIIHELFHHLRYLTLGKDLGNMMYVGTIYDEGITDFLTMSTGVENPQFRGYVSGYGSYHNVIADYINLFGDDAIESFFYGTKEFIDSVYTAFATEHNAFVLALDHYLDDELSKLACRTILDHWRDFAAKQMQ